jgi:hypothetical protein
MDLMLLRMFQRQVRFQCLAIITGWQDFNKAMATEDMTSTWIAIQATLNASANISKALWGQSGRLAEPRKELRESLQVDDSSPLKEVAMRNNFEHYDQRLDQWWKNSEAHNHLDMSMFAEGAIVGIADQDMFRVLDPTTGDIVFWGQRFNLPTLAQEAIRLLPIAKTEADKPHWEPPEPPVAANDNAPGAASDPPTEAPRSSPSD